MRLPELLFVLEFNFLLTILISNDLEISNSSPKFLTSHCNSIHFNFIFANNSSFYSLLLGCLNVISGYNPDCDRLWSLRLWFLYTILQHVDSFLNIWTKIINETKGSEIN